MSCTYSSRSAVLDPITAEGIRRPTSGKHHLYHKAQRGAAGSPAVCIRQQAYGKKERFPLNPQRFTLHITRSFSVHHISFPLFLSPLMSECFSSLRALQGCTTTRNQFENYSAYEILYNIVLHQLQ